MTSINRWIVLLALLSPGAVQAESPEPKHIRAAVDRSLPLLQSSADTWIQKQSCVSCHHQGLGMMAVSLARERGWEISEELLERQFGSIRPGARSAEFKLQGDFGINSPFGISFLGVAIGSSSGEPKVGAMDALAHFVAGKQDRNGSWRSESHRPPIEDSPVTVTALSLRILQLFPSPGRTKEMGERIASARRWLEDTRPKTNEERAMRLFGIGWSNAKPEAISRAVKDLLTKQRSDGGWAQLATRQSDPYATGQSLVALNQAGGLPVEHPAYRRGLRFLVEQQKEDGSWHVETRRKFPGLPYFESGFPHGEDQFISYAASAWATMALTLTIDAGPSQTWMRTTPVHSKVALEHRARAPGITPLMQASFFGSREDVERQIKEGAKVNTVTPRGITALMCAVHDSEKVRLLLEAGAKVDGMTKDGSTALTLAAGYDGALESMKVLLAAGASLELAAEADRAPLILASDGGDLEKVELLLARGVKINDFSGQEISPLMIACVQGDVEMVRFLLDHGATMASPGHVPFLVEPLISGDEEMLEFLLSRGAQLDDRCEGLTALMVAAMHDPGHTRIVEMLLRAGAKASDQSADGLTAVELARVHNHPALELLLEVGESGEPGR